MYGIAERVKDCRDIGIKVRDVMYPDIASRHDEVLTVGSIYGISDTLGIAAQMTSAR